MKQRLLSRSPRSQINTTDGSNQVTRKFHFRVTPVNFSWGRPTVAWGWTDLGHQGSMSVFTRNKCYRILDLRRITCSPCVSSEPNFNPTKIFGILVFKWSFLNVLSQKNTFLLNHIGRKISTGTSKNFTCLLWCSPRIHISKSSSNQHANYYFSSSTSQSNSNICRLRLGTTLCHPHECNNDEMIKPNRRHGLKCKQATSQTMRQEDVNKLIMHGLDQVKFPSTLEPILWNNVFCQEVQDPKLILLMVQIR